MRILRNKKVATVSLVLVLTMAATPIAFLPIVNAADVSTYAFISVSPNPVGVGQMVSIIVWLQMAPPTAAGYIGDRWQGYEITIEEPDGTIKSLGPFKSDPVGAYWLPYTPGTTGKYYFQFSFPGQHIEGPGAFGGYINATYLPSTSSKVELTVQDEQLEPWPAAALPADYWERPIYAENREWWPISGNWLATGAIPPGGTLYNVSGNFNPYTKAPDSPHIVWTKPIAFGGLIGGEYGGGGTSSYYTGREYEAKFTPIIMNGILYYNVPDPPRYGFYAVDLRTGETLWWKNGTGELPPVGMFTQPNLGVSCGQIFNYITGNQYGGIPYLWSYRMGGDWATTWHMYDAFTGNRILSLTNVTLTSSMGAVSGPDGELLVYLLDGTNNWLALWNSTKAIPPPFGGFGTFGIMWRPPQGATLDWRDGIQWNVTVPSYHTPLPQSFVRLTRTLIGSGVLIATTGIPTGGSMDWQMEIGYNATTGESIWVENRTLPSGSIDWMLMGPIMDGIYTEYHAAKLTWYGFNAYTGKQVWETKIETGNDWAYYLTNAAAAYDRLYACHYDMVRCFDLKTGDILGEFSAGPSGLETIYPDWPFGLMEITVADGKVFTGIGHTHLQPLFRGAKLYALDDYTEEELWSISFWLGEGFSGLAIADGYAVADNCYDNQIYCFGKGQTATTVTIQDDIIPKGDSVLIKGTVTDQSPGDTCLGIPAAGTPAIADEDMTEWMEYLYMQKPCPMDVNGVPVKLEVFGEDGSYSEIGTVTSDAYGDFVYEWTPPDEGLYTIMATFEGSDSYWRSYDATHLSVGAAPEAPAEPEEAPAFTTSDLILMVAVVVAIVIGIVNLWALRKRS